MSELQNRATTAADSLHALAAEVQWAGGHRQAVRALYDARDSALAASAFIEAAEHLDEGSPVAYVNVSRLDRLDGVGRPSGIVTWPIDPELEEPPLRPCWDVIVAWLCLLGALVLLIVGYDAVINGYEVLAFVLVIIGLTGLARWVMRR